MNSNNTTHVNNAGNDCMAIDLTPDTDGEASSGNSSEASPDNSFPQFAFDPENLLDPSNFELAQQLLQSFGAMDDSVTDLQEDSPSAHTHSHPAAATTPSTITTTTTTANEDNSLLFDNANMNFEFITDLANQLNSIYGKTEEDSALTPELNALAMEISSPSMKERYLGTINLDILGSQHFDGHLIPGSDVTLSKTGFDAVQIKALSRGEWSVVGQLAKNVALWVVPLLDSPKVKIVAHLPNDLDNDLFVVVKFYLYLLPGATDISLDPQELSAFQSLSTALSKPLQDLVPITIKQSTFVQPFYSPTPLSFSTNGLPLPQSLMMMDPSSSMRPTPLFNPSNPKKRDLAMSCPTLAFTPLKRPKFEPGQRFLDTEFSSNLETDPSEIQQLLGGLHCNHDQIPEMEPSELLMLTLRPYQKQALGWMVSRERSQSELMLISQQEKKKLPHPWKEYTTSTGLPYYYNPETKATTWEWPDQKQAVKHEVAKVSVRGGILADQMGMGKTIEILSVILTNAKEQDSMEGGGEGGEGGREKSEYSKTNLVVCPLSVLAQWLDEIRTHTAPGKVSVYVYHGTNRTRDPAFLAQHDVVLTTYSTLAAELPSEKKTFKRQRKSDQRPALLEMKWYRIILDEAHTIKDRSTRTAKAAFALRAERRWCVTGTPIQNKLEDLFSLFHFLRLEPYGELNNWNQLIMKPMRNKDDHGLTILQSVLEVILLRRTKDQRINNVPIVSLPPRIVKLRTFVFREEEDDFYQSLWSQSKTKFNAYVQAGSVLKNYAHILELLLRLRQACNHPYLVLNNKRTTTDISNVVQKYLLEAKMGNAGACEQLKELMNDWHDDECMLCLEVMEEPVVTPCGHLFCRNCILKHLMATTMGTACAACGRRLNPSELINLPKKEERQGMMTMTPIAKSVDCNEQLPWKSSTKIDALMSELFAVHERDPTIKSIVFSQWTSMLDLVEIPLKHAGIRFVRLDGSMVQAQRETAIRLFRTDPQIKIFLVSMKAGGLGLNLTSASHVYLLDPWWNPASEDQAIDRVHRLGQTRPVVVTRFIIQGTIEERILDMQKTKKQLAQDLMVRSKEARQIRIDELRSLFRD